MESPSSDAPRQSLLGSINFLSRSARPRTTLNHTSNTQESSQLLTPLATSNSSPGHRRRTVLAVTTSGPTVTQPSNNTNSGLGYMLRRRRSANNDNEAPSQRSGPNADDSATPQDQSTGSSHRIRLVPHLESHRSLHFDAITRDVRQGDTPLRIGRFTERSTHSGNNSNKLAFKSKVVSRGHAEIWFDSGSFYIKDTKSSSGTFLNHIRLSSPNTESRPYPVKDGDILQLGVDYQGGTEEIYRCVKMRIELGREWQSGVNAFNSNALQQLKTLSGAVPSKKDPLSPTSLAPAGKRAKSNITDCCICLFQVTVCQALFIAPCSHVYHYKCIRPLIEMHHPGFSCPLCRTFADLEADVEVEAAAEPEKDESNSNEADGAQQEDVDMLLEEAAAEAENNMSSSRESEQLQQQAENIDTTPSISTPLPADTTASLAVAIPRQPSADGFSGAEATPLNSTFLATLIREGSGRSNEGGTPGLLAIAVSDDDEDDGDEDEQDHEQDAPGEEGGVGGKRKR